MSTDAWLLLTGRFTPVLKDGAPAPMNALWWKQEFSQQRQLAKVCQCLTDSQWTVHSIIYTPSVVHGDVTAVGACVVAFKDEPDLTGGVPR